VVARVYGQRARSSVLLCARSNAGELDRKVTTVAAGLIAKQQTLCLLSNGRASWR
jgi:hypothetical protein